jgi:alpha-glucosidase
MAVATNKLFSDPGDDPRFNNESVHEIHRFIRRVLDDYDGAVAVGEVWVYDNAQFAAYLRHDELHLGFNFRLVRAEFDADELRGAVDNSLAAVALEGATPTWTLSNHDVEREVTRYGGGDLGLARAKAMALVMLALPGAVFIYNGEELGLPNVELPDEVLQDPVWFRSGGRERGRDGCRVPMPWQGDEPPFGFSANTGTWLPMPLQWAALTVEHQLHEPNSTLSFFRRALQLRRGLSGGTLEWLDAPTGGLMFRVSNLVCALNVSAAPFELPDGEVLFASGPLIEARLPSNTAVWLA